VFTQSTSRPCGQIVKLSGAVPQAVQAKAATKSDAKRGFPALESALAASLAAMIAACGLLTWKGAQPSSSAVAAREVRQIRSQKMHAPPIQDAGDADLGPLGLKKSLTRR
jgi:hypothetical protein